MSYFPLMKALNRNTWFTFEIIKGTQASWEKLHFETEKVFLGVVLTRPLFAQLQANSSVFLCCSCGFFSWRTSVFLILSLYRKGRGAARAVKLTGASKWCNRLPWHRHHQPYLTLKTTTSLAGVEAA